MSAWYGPGFNGVSTKPLADGMKTTGNWLTGWYGREVYKIGITAYQGSDGMIGSPAAPVSPLLKAASKSGFIRLGFSEAFLPLRAGKAGKAVPVSPVLMRIPKYKAESIASPAQAFDAIYFIDTMTPAAR